jgi:hypothetical protein
MDINRINLGNDIQTLFMNDFESLCKERPRHSYQARRWKLGDAAEANEMFLINHKCSKVDLSHLGENQVNEAFQRLNAVLTHRYQIAFLPQTFPVIDAAGPGRQVFQITLAAKHNPRIAQVRRLLVAARLLTVDRSGNLSVCREPEPLTLDWVVPPNMFVEWGSKACVTFRQNELSAGDLVVKHCWDNYVMQYALEIPSNPPTLTEDHQQALASIQSEPTSDPPLLPDDQHIGT